MKPRPFRRFASNRSFHRLCRYVVLFEIEGDHAVTVLAVRHQRKEDDH
ncbi:type II toxin-antitoxin system RelE/ParE family toxin [Rhizobium mongolense]|nr:type II toxin-antitoxin system RelE/ParE family toxin [Rhizobium sp. CC1099]WFU88160.1 type II toxin-antitoxin system RelE/ParE family toxin [Rhizobium sp. CC1099]